MWAHASSRRASQYPLRRHCSTRALPHHQAAGVTQPGYAAHVGGSECGVVAWCEAVMAADGVDEAKSADRAGVAGVAAARDIGEEHYGTTADSVVAPPQEAPPEGIFSARPLSALASANEATSLASVSAAHVDGYCRSGFLVVRDAFSAGEVASMLEAVDELRSERNVAFNAACAETAGKLGGIEWSDGPAATPTMQFEPAAEGRKLGDRGDFVRKLQNYHNYEPRLCVHDNPEVQRVIRMLIWGSDAAEAADDARFQTELFQSLALLKPPLVGRAKEWHMDHAYFNLDVSRAASGAPTEVVGLWLALDDTDEANGCMHVVAGGHLRGPRVHFQRRDWMLCDDDLAGRHFSRDDVYSVPMKAGDLLLFSSLLPHGTPPNRSERSRRAVQYHVVPRGMRRVPKAERLRLFGGEGSDVSC